MEQQTTFTFDINQIVPPLRQIEGCFWFFESAVPVRTRVRLNFRKNSTFH